MSRPPTGRSFEVWAPKATTGVDLVLERAGRDGTRDTIPMTAGERGWWRAWAEAESGDRYGFRIDGGEVRYDPRGCRLPDGPHEMSAVYDVTSYTWQDITGVSGDPNDSGSDREDWTGIELRGAVLYELHIGTFTAEGTLDAAIGRLDHLVRLGIDMVELMPVASFPGRYGWGYDGVAPYAVHEPYGGPAALQRFVDACHARGLGVCLDVVYNHLGPDGNYLNEFAPYFTSKYDTPWGWAVNLDGPGSDTVRDYLVGNATQWFRDFHLDALRLDAVHELYDARALTFLEELSIRIDALAEETGRRMWLIAESDRNDQRTVVARDRGGLGIHAQWADDVHHGLHVALTGEDQGYYGDFAAPGALATVLTRPFLHAGTWSTFRERTHGRPVEPDLVEGWQFVVSLQTHDQVGNRRTGDRLAASLSPRRLCAGAALLLTGPYTPMLFMGEEWAASTPWQYFTDHVDTVLADAVRTGRREEFASHGWTHHDVPDPQALATVHASTLNWDEIEQGDHAEVLLWYRALLALRSARPDLRDPDLAATRVEYDHERRTVISFRGRHRVAVNLGAEPVDLDLELNDYDRCVPLLSLDPTVELVRGVVRLDPDGAVVVGPAATG